MLLIHKPQSYKKLFFLVITSICSVGALLGLSALTYTPELSHAETVVSPEPKPDLSSITYMQDITQEICTNTKKTDAKNNYQYQLIDKRDNKAYWVAKLKDNNCWMTQNLDYNGGGIATTPSKWGNSNASAQYFDPGMYVFTTPLRPNKCADTGTGQSSCTRNGWKEVSNLTASTEPDFYLNHDSAVNETTYDAHYMAGNYYSWAAVANENNTIDNICPAGWQVPTSGSGGQFATLMGGLTATTTAGSNNLKYPPYHFVYGGYVDRNALVNAGNNGFYWSSTAYDDTAAYYLYFYTSPSPADTDSRYYGMSVRCVVPGKEEGVSQNDDNIKVTITPTISLDVTNEVEVKKSETNPSTAAFSALVASNQPYSVSISSTNPNMTSSTNSTTIPSKSGTLTSNENAWGIKLSTASTYEQITTTPKLFYSSSNPESKSLPFTIGISTASDIPNGEYSTNITITATQN